MEIAINSILNSWSDFSLVRAVLSLLDLANRYIFFPHDTANDFFGYLFTFCFQNGINPTVSI